MKNLLLINIAFSALSVSAGLRGPRPNVTSSTDLSVLEVDIFSVFDDLATNLQHNYATDKNDSIDTIINNILLLQSDDTNDNSNIHIRGNSPTSSASEKCSSRLANILTIATLVVTVINLLVVLLGSRTYIKYRIPGENLLYDEHSITPQSSQSRSI